MEPTKEAWAKLYDIAMKIRKQKPWQWMEISEIFAIEDPVTGVNYYCSVETTPEADYVQLLVGEDSLNRIVGLLESISRGSEYLDEEDIEDEIYPDTSSLASYMLGFDEHSLSCYFTNKERLSPYELEVLDQLGLGFRGSKQWISFKHQRPGQYTESVHDAEDVRVLTLLLEQIYVICDQEKKNAAIHHMFNQAADLYRWRYHSEKQEWRSERMNMNRLLGQAPKYVYPNQLEVAKVRRLKGSRQVYELLRIYLPMPVEHGDCLRFPVTFLLVDMENGMVVWSYVDVGDEGYEGRTLEQLTGFFLKEGRKPSRLLTADYVVHQLVSDYCDRCKIFLEYLAYTVTGDEILESFMESAIQQGQGHFDGSIMEMDKRRSFMESIMSGKHEPDGADKGKSKAKPKPAPAPQNGGGVIIDFRTGKPIQ